MPNGAAFTYRDWTRRWGCRAPNPASPSSANENQILYPAWFLSGSTARAGPIAALITPKGALPSRSGRTRAKGKGSGPRRRAALETEGFRRLERWARPAPRFVSFIPCSFTQGVFVSGPVSKPTEGRPRGTPL